MRGAVTGEIVHEGINQHVIYGRENLTRIAEDVGFFR